LVSGVVVSLLRVLAFQTLGVGFSVVARLVRALLLLLLLLLRCVVMCMRITWVCRSDDAGTRLCGGGPASWYWDLPRVLPRYLVLIYMQLRAAGCIDAEAD